MAAPIAMTADSPRHAEFYRLTTWLSPAYPTGAFSYSHGLEYAVEAGLVRDAEATRTWVEDVVRFGSARNDGIFLICSHQAAEHGKWGALREVAELAAAYAPSAELALETTAQGAAFLRITRDVWACRALERLVGDWPGPHTYPVTVGVAAAGHGIAAEWALLAYLNAFAANLVSAAVRLVPLGQNEGQRIIAELEAAVAHTTGTLLNATLDDLGTGTPMVDYASMKHETQYTRLFRS